MKFEFGYGNGYQSVEIEEANILYQLTPNEISVNLTGVDEVIRALYDPIAGSPLREIASPGEKIVIVTSDITRPMPSSIVMPLLLDELYSAGIPPSDITLVFALGIHRKHTEEEKRVLAGERAWNEITCIDGDNSDIVRKGVTSRGTPVDIVRVVAQADRRICLGNIEYHYFAGYSGGGKAIMPGVSTNDAIRNNHSFMTDNLACAGNLDGNPIREDIEEAANMVGVDFILNVVLDESKKIIKAVAGHCVQAHRKGCEFLDALFIKRIDKKADIVIVSQGGSPKDINLYQTQKALDNAKHAVKSGGIIILIGSCKEGFGERTFEEWMMQSPSPESMVERIKRDFQLGGHKAAAIAMILKDSDIFLVSELPHESVIKMHMTPFADAQSALDAAFLKIGRNASVITMPFGGSTLPRMI